MLTALVLSLQITGFDLGPPQHKPLPAWTIALPAAGQWADSYTTRQIRLRGEQPGYSWVELNPIVAALIHAGVKGRGADALKVAGGIGFGLACREVSRTHPTRARWFLGVGTAIGIGLSVHNAYRLRHPVVIYSAQGAR